SRRAQGDDEGRLPRRHVDEGRPGADHTRDRREMPSVTVLPYGAWPSPISAEMLATAGVGLSEAKLDDGIVYWTEQRPTEGGRGVVCKGDPHTTPVDVTPPGFDARTRVHEYGGGPYTVCHGTVYFSNRPDARLYR